MWIIQNVYNDDCFALTSEKRKYVIGRVDADIELLNDNSVSRSHAELLLVPSKTDSGMYQLILQDVGSKYGTYRNKGIQTNQHLSKNEQVQLNPTDIVRFGRLKNIWRIQYYQLNVVMSSLTKTEQSEMKELMKHIDGTLMEEWSNICTHLTINTPSVTIKLLKALVEQKEVITMEYWRDFLKYVKTGKFKMIKSEYYRPNFPEQYNLDRQSARRTLFQGLTFVFLHRKHYDAYESIVCDAGGTCKNLKDGVQKSLLLSSDVIVIQYIPSTQTQSSQTINSIIDYLHNNSKRIIPEYEIGLAILYCSVKRYCNPSYVEVNSTDLAVSEEVDLIVPQMNPPINEKEGISEHINTAETLGEEANPRKRKYANLSLNSNGDENENSYNFTKKICSKHSLEKPAEPLDINDSLENDIETEELRQASRNLQFSESKQIVSDVSQTKDYTNNNVNRKRPIVPILSDDSSDDLFDFGNKSGSPPQKKNNNLNNELFGFNNNSPQSFDAENINDMTSTQKYMTSKTNKEIRKTTHGIKPKPLPKNVPITNWITCSFKSVKQNESGTHLDGNHKKDIKINDYDQKWEILLENVIEIKPIVTIKCKVECSSSDNNADKSYHSNGVLKNFKSFVKKYHPSQREVAVVHLRSHIV